MGTGQEGGLRPGGKQVGGVGGRLLYAWQPARPLKVGHSAG
jgi:hypothetical protein